MKHLFIVNPVAGGKKNHHAETIAEINHLMAEVGGKYEAYITKAPLDACRKIEEDAASGEELRVYACGGDGTFNECINSSAGRENVAVTSYPCGTGNDFIKTFGDDAVKFHDLRELVTGPVRKIDAIRCGDRWCANICSVGIDARIGTDVHKYSQIPLIGGAASYVVSLLVNVFKGIASRMKITAGDFEEDSEHSLVCACNGRYYGGGFNPVPEAMLDDGIMDVLVVKKVSLLRFFGTVVSYAGGKYKEHSEIIRHIPCKKLTIEAPEEFVVNNDGEAFFTKKVTFELQAGALRLIHPAGVKLFA